MPKREIKADHEFNVNDTVQCRSQIVRIEFIDYTRNVYIFDKTLNHHWTKWESMSFEMADKILTKID